MHERTARYTVAERHALVAEQRQSGLSATAFCREHGLVYQTFVGWRRRLAAAGDDHGSPPTATPVSPASNTLPEFIELGITESGSTPASDRPDRPWLVELELGSGMTLRVRQPS